MLVTLAEAKSHLYLTVDTHDVYLQDLIDEAEQYLADDLHVTVEELPEQPKPVKRALRFLIAHWFEKREPVTTDNRSARPLPMSYESIVFKYRNKSIL